VEERKETSFDKPQYTTIQQYKTWWQLRQHLPLPAARPSPFVQRIHSKKKVHLLIGRDVQSVGMEWPESAKKREKGVSQERSTHTQPKRTQNRQMEGRKEGRQKDLIHALDSRRQTKTPHPVPERDESRRPCHKLLFTQIRKRVEQGWVLLIELLEKAKQKMSCHATF
jgi:hypothetical protein